MIRIFTLIVISALLSGGATGQETDGCAERPKTMININFAKNSEIRVFPGRARVDLGHYLRFVVTGDAGTKVTISGKNSDSEWITAAWEIGAEKGGRYDDGSGDRFVDVCVRDLDIPKDPGEKTYAYIIEVDGVGNLDPEVTVRR